MDHIEQIEETREIVKIAFKAPPPFRVIPIDEHVEELELEDPERWDGLS